MRLQAPVLMLVSFFFVKFAQSQSNELIVLGQTGRLYLEHSVVAGQNWYSVGRLYNENPKVLAPFNHLTLAQPLVIGQTLQIPLTSVNFSQDGKKTPAETLIPVYYIVGEKEWMYRVSVNHNKVPIPTLEKWNKLGKDGVHPGLHLVVGYLKVKTALSALAKEGGGMSAAATTKPAANAESTVANPSQVKTALTSDSPAAVKPAAAKPSIAKPAIAKPVADKPVSANPAPVSSNPAPVEATPAPAASHTDPATPHFNGGSFRADFSDGGKSTTGQAGIFKSTSGWQDGKYYALMNNVAVGTIIKVTDPVSGKNVFVKVLGQLPDMKESAGLAIRISNAAAAEMGEGDGRFSVEINY